MCPLPPCHLLGRSGWPCYLPSTREIYCCNLCVQIIIFLRISCLIAVVSKTKHSKTKTEARSTQISKTKHPRLENEAPKTRKWSTQISKPLLKDYNFKSCMTQAKPGRGNGCIKALKWPRIVVPSSVHKSAKVWTFDTFISDWSCFKLITFDWQDWQALTVTAVIPYIV